MRTRKWLLIGAIGLLACLLVAAGGAGDAQPAQARALWGFTPTPTPTNTPTPTATLSPNMITPTATPPPNLRITQSAPGACVAPSGAFVYTILVENLGPGAATGVIVTDDVPAQLEVKEASATQGTVTIAGNEVTVNVGVLGVGYSSTIAITAQVKSNVAPGAQIENVASVLSDETYETTSIAEVRACGLLPEAGTGGGTVAVTLTLVLAGAALAVLGLRHRRRVVYNE
jgi:uncharacterized repeat protein (TIGR01451 family)